MSLRTLDWLVSNTLFFVVITEYCECERTLNKRRVFEIACYIICQGIVVLNEVKSYYG